MTEYKNNPLTCGYIASFGIDPNAIPLDGWDFRGYETFRKGPDGRNVYEGEDGPIVRDRHSWPEGFVYGELLARWAKDQRAFHGYPQRDYWESQTPDFRERALSLALDAERTANERERARTAKARAALANVGAAVDSWDWIPERGDVLTLVKEALA